MNSHTFAEKLLDKFRLGFVTFSTLGIWESVWKGEGRCTWHRPLPLKIIWIDSDML